ncbi:hypothetical protein M434DRAFT_398615 [Hypoxylon sp. CO27-5]|nr:hypothetical protein M434DRAFT_398615 [Hypoxylon sp. CO27-5]
MDVKAYVQGRTVRYEGFDEPLGHVYPSLNVFTEESHEGFMDEFATRRRSTIQYVRLHRSARTVGPMAVLGSEFRNIGELIMVGASVFCRIPVTYIVLLIYLPSQRGSG